MSESLYQDLKNLEGTESEPRPGNDRVSEAMIRHWCEVMQDANPVYTDRSCAEATVRRWTIAPPTMVQAYFTPPLWPPSGRCSSRPPFDRATAWPPLWMRSEAGVAHQAGPRDCAICHHPAQPDGAEGP